MTGAKPSSFAAARPSAGAAGFRRFLFALLSSQICSCGGRGVGGCSLAWAFSPTTSFGTSIRTRCTGTTGTRTGTTTALLAAKKKGKAKSKGGGGGGGFGGSKSGGAAVAEKSATEDVLPAPVRNRGPKYEFGSGLGKDEDNAEEEDSIEHYLHPRLFEHPSTLDSIRTKLRDGDIVVLRDAFRPDFADAMHRELLSTSTWSRNENYLDDGYHYRHYNVYDKSDYSKFFNDTLAMLDTGRSKKFMTDLTGRDCTGETVGSPSYYGGGDHSLPHTDHFGQRTVAYVWHLSKNWRPEWGGGLYWAQEPLANAYLHASYNTLVLFSVTPLSSHFVTTVSPHATERRLSFNGWWQSSWVPTLDGNEMIDVDAACADANAGGAAQVDNVPLEDAIDTPQKRLRLTHTQYVTIDNLLHDPWSPRVQPDERRELLEGYMARHMEESYPKPRSPPIV